MEISEIKKIMTLNWNSWTLNIRVIPWSKDTSIVWIMANWVLKIKIKSIAENGKANNDLEKFLANYFWVNKSSVFIISWQTNQNKVIRIDF